MKAIMVMFDSLNRRMLSPYGCDWVQTPNFARLAGRTVTFDNAYVGSMPCMPARRELHTGRYNFLHRSWGPLEPFDDSVPEILKQAGIYTHLSSDHYHYWEDGGCTYHNRYSSWEFFRGQEGDPWKGHVADPAIPEAVSPRSGPMWRQDWVNRGHLDSEEKMPQAQTFAAGEEFIRTNHAQDNWFLHIETFDPHEPYFTQKAWKDLYPHHYTGRHFDWPPYARVTETKEEVAHLRFQNAALHSMCDHYMGRILDLMDEYDLWKDTLLIVNTDHGFLLGEHDLWAKVAVPYYDEIAHTPLFIWDPRVGKSGERRQALVQTIDLPATILEFFGLPLPPDMQGVPLRRTLEDDAPVRQAALFGHHGGHVNVTDGRYVYMRAPRTPNAPLHQYTHLPTHMRGPFHVKELQDIRLTEPFTFTKGCRVMKISCGGSWGPGLIPETMLFDLATDPHQQTPITDPAVEKMMISHLSVLMKSNDAPPEQWERLGL